MKNLLAVLIVVLTAASSAYLQVPSPRLVQFDTTATVFPTVPHEGRMFYKDNGPNDSLYIYSEGAWHAVWPSAGAPSMVFGDTNAYFVAKTFGAGYDSIAGHYFNTIQGAINAATAANDSIHFKTVYILPGQYAEPCSIKNFVSLRGYGKYNTKLYFNGTTANYLAGARRFGVSDLSIFYTASAGCSVAVGGCKIAHYENVDFKTPTSSQVIAVYFQLAALDTMIMENCDIGRSGDLDGYGVFNGTTAGYLILKNFRVCYVGGGNTSDITTSGSSLISLNNCQFIDFNGIGLNITDGGWYSTYFYAQNCAFRGKYTAISFGGAPSAVEGIYLYNVACNGLIVSTNYAKTIYARNVSVTDQLGNNGPIQALITWNGDVSWTYSGVAQSFFFGGLCPDTTKNAAPLGPHEGQTFYFSSAAPHDTFFVYMDAGWRNLDRTWAVGRDSVMANMAADTLTVTGLELGNYIDVQYESDPGVNVGFPYHTVTSGQDIITWPVACVNKFYYRWRVH